MFIMNSGLTYCSFLILDWNIVHSEFWIEIIFILNSKLIYFHSEFWIDLFFILNFGLKYRSFWIFYWIIRHWEFWIERLFILNYRLKYCSFWILDWNIDHSEFFTESLVILNSGLKHCSFWNRSLFSRRRSTGKEGQLLIKMRWKNINLGS